VTSQPLLLLRAFLSSTSPRTRATLSSCVQLLPRKFKSYTHFLQVKESRILEAMHLFEDAGFHLYNPDSSSSIPTSLSSPVSDDLSADFTSNSGAILTRNIGGRGMSNPRNDISTEPPSPGQQSPRSKSHSPTSSEVRMLGPDLACVGLSEEFGVDHWGLKIVKLVAFPDLIPPSPRTTSYSPYQNSDPSGLASDLTSALFTGHRGGISDDSCSCSSSSDDDGYFSHSPQNVSTTSLTTTNTSRSYSDLKSVSYDPSLYKTPSKHFISTISPLTPITPKKDAALPLGPPVVSISTDSSPASKAETHIPFFSFTRTPEGSSLTADVHVLATLFPQHERHMVICSGELDAADQRLEGHYSSDEEEDDHDSDLFRGSSSYKCLQIDLRRFGLGAFGPSLVKLPFSSN